MKKIIVGISGASGAVYGMRALELLREVEGVETHLVLTDAAVTTLKLEVASNAVEVAKALADKVYDNGNMAAAIASGSFKSDGMIIAPCSMRTLSAVAYGNTDSLLVRAADVMLKERRPLVLMARETPLHAGHLKAMLMATEHGAIVAPPVPAFYVKPDTIDQMITQTVGRALESLRIDMGDAVVRWPSIRNSVKADDCYCI